MKFTNKKPLYISLSALLLVGIVSAQDTFADGDHSAPKGQSRFSKDSAVTDFSPEDGFKLSESSISSLGVRFTKLDKGAPWSISKNALVGIKHVTGVYRRVNGWISFVLVETTNGSGSNSLTTIRSEDLQDGDEVATEGVSFLRMTEADLNSDTVDSCAH